MTLTLSPEQERRVLSKLHDGSYADPNEVIDEALRLLEEYEWQINFRASPREAERALDSGERITWNAETKSRVIKDAIEHHRLGRIPNPDVCP